MLDALSTAFEEVTHRPLAGAAHRMFIGALCGRGGKGALPRLRAHVRSLDNADYDAFIRVAQAMRTEAYARLRAVEANGRRIAGGGAGEDRMPSLWAHIPRGGHSRSRARVQHAQATVARLGGVIELSEHYRHAQHAASRVGGGRIDQAEAAVTEDLARTDARAVLHPTGEACPRVLVVTPKCRARGSATPDLQVAARAHERQCQSQS